MFWKNSEPELPVKYLQHKLVTVDEDHYDRHDLIHEMLNDLACFNWELVTVIETSYNETSHKELGKIERYKCHERHYYFKRTSPPPEQPIYCNDIYLDIVAFVREKEKRDRAIKIERQNNS